MRTLSTILLAVALLCGSAYCAEPVPVKLTKQESVNLYNALGSITKGLSPLDTITAADDLNSLEPVVIPFMKGQRKALTDAQEIDPTDPKRLQKQAAILLPIEAAGDDPIQVKGELPGEIHLIPLDISTDEIKAGEIPASTLSILRRFLASPKPKP